MAKKRKRKAEEDAAHAAQKPAPAPGIATSIGPLLERAGLSRAPHPKPQATPAASVRSAPAPVAPAVLASRPRAPHSTGELAALNDAYRGVQPIARPKHAQIAAPRAPRPRGPAQGPDAGDADARERLSALVGGGVRFEVRWDDGLVEGVRSGVSEKLLHRLSGRAFEPQATLDLHGMRRAPALRAVHDFVRAEKRNGAQRLLVIVGKGTHSEDGVGVLGAAAVEALTQGGAAPLVAAFASAHARHGGSGAIAVLLG